MTDKPGVNGEPFKISLNFYDFRIGEDYLVVTEPEKVFGLNYPEDPLDYSWTYTIKPLSDRAKEYFNDSKD